MILWMKIREKGYKRSYKSMCRALKRLQLENEEKARHGYSPKPYAAAEYPGQKVQIDVTFREMYDEHSTYSSLDFILKVIAFFPFKIELVQTDNGSEWTNALTSNNPTPTLFEQALIDAGISYKRIRIATPRHNGKVERQHREDEKRFYKKLRMYSLEDGRKQLKRYNRFSNTIPKVCLDFKSPNEVLTEYLRDHPEVRRI